MSTPIPTEAATIQHGFTTNCPFGGSHTCTVTPNEIFENNNYSAYGVSCSTCNESKIKFEHTSRVQCISCGEWSRLHDIASKCIYCGNQPSLTIIIDPITLTVASDNTSITAHTRSSTSVAGTYTRTYHWERRSSTGNGWGEWETAVSSSTQLDHEAGIFYNKQGILNSINPSGWSVNQRQYRVTFTISGQGSSKSVTSPAVTITKPTSTLTVSTTSWVAASSLTSKTITVTSNISWTVSSSSTTWLAVSPSSGSNNGSFTINVSANTGSMRNGTITVSGGGISKTIAVTQTGGHTHGGYTYTSNGNITHTQKCGTCDYTQTANHNMVSGTCTYKSCSDCTYSTGSSSHTEGSWQKTTEEHWKNCSANCGHQYVARTAHTWSYLNQGSSGHIRKCSPCGEQSTVEAHGSFTYAKSTGTNHTKKCGIGSCSYSVSETHTWSYVNQGVNGHIRKCSPCGEQSTVEAHGSFTYAKSTGTNHTKKCGIGSCSYSVSEAHTWSYVNQGVNGHIRKCTPCGEQSTVEAHGSFTYAKSTGSNHIKKCGSGSGACSYNVSETHTWSYLNQGSGGHIRKCTPCGEQSTVEAHTYSGNGNTCTGCGYKKP